MRGGRVRSRYCFDPDPDLSEPAEDVTPRKNFPGSASLRLLPPRCQIWGTFSQFLTRYPNPKTHRVVEQYFRSYLESSGIVRLDQLDEATVVTWAISPTAKGTPAANNTIFQRTSMMRTFTKWCVRKGHLATDPLSELADRSHPIRRYRRTSGKLQSQYPGRWLSHHQAYTQLLSQCDRSTPRLIRDEVIMRLGLSGLRASEITSLTLRHVGNLPDITFVGKGHKVATVTVGAATVEAIRLLVACFPSKDDTQPLIPPTPKGHARVQGERLAYGSLATGHLVFDIVTRHARETALGHVAPHDLRRTAAGILHNAKSDDGGHLFDLVDIQKVLRHSDPVVTYKHYIEPSDRGTQRRAARLLD